MPTTLPVYRAWRRRTYRDVSVLVRFPNSPDAARPTGRFAEVIPRNQDIVRSESPNMDSRWRDAPSGTVTA
jgi:hypothetical protein